MGNKQGGGGSGYHSTQGYTLGSSDEAVPDHYNNTM
jgi:hypothetical protein